MKNINRGLKVFSMGALALGFTLTLAACTDEGSGDVFKGDGTYASVKDLKDTREEAYTAYTSENEEEKSFTSLYAAVNYVINEMDENAFVTEKGGDINKKMFVNYKQFSESSKDMFWYYADGGQLVEYTQWNPTDWSKLLEHENVTVVYKDEFGESNNYYNSAKVDYIGNLEGINTTFKPGTPESWHSDVNIETMACVDLCPYSGITKVEYEVELTQAKIAPSFNKEETVYALLGFRVSDGGNNSNIGLACDTSTGNWYYYSGEVELGEIDVDTSEVVMTSEWNTSGYYVPKSNITLSMEINLLELDLDDPLDGDFEYELKVSHSGGVFTKGYEFPGMSSEATIRFVAGLDVVDIGSMSDYANGAYFKDLTITKATGTVTQDSIDGITYGQRTAIETAGEYDLLNSNPQSVARWHTFFDNPAFVTCDFETPGKDIYSFNLTHEDVPAFGENISKALDALIVVANIINPSETNKTDIQAARSAYDALSEEENMIITAELYAKLVAAETVLNLVK